MIRHDDYSHIHLARQVFQTCGHVVEVEIYLGIAVHLELAEQRREIIDNQEIRTAQVTGQAWENAKNQVY